ncbi:MAG: pitrilysin family protein [Anaerolineae bacterium]|nr:pitrilysin family protein [Anaerolineae bacterium]
MTSPIYALPNAETITRRVFDNGLVVLVYENPSVESVTIQGSLRAGSIYESRTQNGLASMTASALMRGTKNRDFETLNGALEDIGAELDFGAGKHVVNFSGKSLAEDLDLLVDVLSDALRNPIFPSEEIEEERQKRLTELKYAHTDTRYMAARAFRQALYPKNHPYHYSSYGSLESLPTLSADDVRQFHRQQYGAEGLILVIVGAVKSDEALSIVADKLADWTNPQQVAVPTLEQVTLPDKPVRVDVELVGKMQSDVVLGSLGPSRFADDYIAASLANSILGEFAMMGRLGDVIREKLGLAYYAYSRIEAGEGQGAWHVSAGVAPQNVDLTIEKAREEIQRMTSELVSEDDLADNQSYFTGRLPLRLENNTGLAATIYSLETFKLGLDYLVNYREQIYNITRADILAAAQHYLDADKLVVAVASPTQ